MHKKDEQSNQAHNLQHVNKILTEILDFHAVINDIPSKKTVTFDEALDALQWYKSAVVQIFESPEDLVCQKCASKKES